MMSLRSRFENVNGRYWYHCPKCRWESVRVIVDMNTGEVLCCHCETPIEGSVKLKAKLEFTVEK